MTIEYDLVAEDVVEFNLFHQRNSPAARRNYRETFAFLLVMSIALGALAWDLFLGWDSSLWESFPYGIPIIVGTLLIPAAFPRIYYRSVRRLVEQLLGEAANRGLLCRHAVTLSPEQIDDATPFGRTSMSWSAVERVGTSDGHAFIFLNAVVPIIVPRRASAHDRDFDEFVETARRFHAQAAGGRNS